MNPTNEHREQARETLFYVIPRGARSSYKAVVHTATCPLRSKFRNARTWDRNPLDDDRFHNYDPCQRCKPEPTGGWPSTATAADAMIAAHESASKSRFDGMWGREIRAQVEAAKTAKDRGGLSSRDAEVREVLEGLGKSIGDTWCWCSKPARDGNGSLIHFAACLAARALWEKVQER